MMSDYVTQYITGYSEVKNLQKLQVLLILTCLKKGLGQQAVKIYLITKKVNASGIFICFLINKWLITKTI